LAGGIAIAVFTASYVTSTYGYETSEQAQAVAIGGAEDALLLLARNSSYSVPGGYVISIGSSTATVSITQNSPSVGFATILSQGTIASRVRKVQVIVSINGTTGQASVVSWNEVQ